MYVRFAKSDDSAPLMGIISAINSESVFSVFPIDDRKLKTQVENAIAGNGGYFVLVAEERGVVSLI